MDVLSIFASSAVAVAAVSVAIFLLRNLILERLKAAIGHEYALELERHRAKLDAENARVLEAFRAEASLQQSALATAFGSLTAAHMAGHERTLAAIETLWQEVRRIANWMPLYASRSDTLLPPEFPEAYSEDPTFKLLIDDADEYSQTRELTGDEPVEKARPFVGEYLYSLFYAYRAFNGRVARLLLEGRRRRHVASWHDDRGIKSILRTILTEEEFRAIPLASVGRIRAVQQVVEQKMLEHIAKLLSGEASATFNLRQAREILAAASAQDLSGA